MGKNLLLLFSLCISALTLAQETDTEKKKNYEDILKSKDQIIAGAAIGFSPANFVDKDFRVGNWTNIQYNSQWAVFSYGLGEMTKKREGGNFDTVALREFTIGANFSVKKLAKGSRLYDMRGVLMIPTVAVAIGNRVVEKNKILIGKISPGVSFQFPFCAIDFKVHSSFNINNQISGLKAFAFTPEVALKIDGLYSLLDAKRVYIGHAEGTQTFRSTGYSTTSHRDGDYIITTTYKTETTTVMPYSIDRNATVIGPLVAIGPHVGFSNHPYAGITRTYGLGYYISLGFVSSDFLVDAGRIGFGSSMKETQTIDNPKPQPAIGVNKDDFSNRGYYTTKRFQARIGVDLFEMYLSTFGEDVAVKQNQTKFSRIIGGLGYGYATISKPHYVSATGQQTADERFAADYTLLSTSGNNARFGKSGPYLTLYCSVEAGALRLTFEANRYFNAYLANVKSISVGYLFPYNRVKKKLKAIRSYEKFIREH